VADAAFAEALAYDPFGVESACQTLPDAPSAGGAGGLGVPLCETARKRGDPDLGRE
jgi:hypothetical protein